MEVILHLKGYCIETAAKKKYEELVRDLLKEDDEEKEKMLEFILDFLKNADFSDLRSKGFDGSEEMLVRVTKIKDKFVVDRL